MATDLVELGRRIAEETGHYSGGPELDFESAGRYTFISLLNFGLLPSHRLLDFGCGSLRNGYWLIRFLDSGNYFGLEPVGMGVKAGLKHLIGPELETFKRPSFAHNKNCDIGEFGVAFDYVMARSVLSHTCPGMIHKMFESFARSSPAGTMYASYWRHDIPEVPPRPAPSLASIQPPKPSWQFWKTDPTPYVQPPGIPPEIERYRGMAIKPENRKKGSKFAVGDELPDDDMRFIAMITYSLSKIQDIAAQYGLTAEEEWTLKPMNKQIWLKITKVP